MKVLIVAAVLTTSELTLYTEDGSSLPSIPQGDERVAKLVELLTPSLSNNIPVELDTDVLNLDGMQVFKDLEKNTNGIVKFFRIARKAVATFFGVKKEDLDPKVLGSMDVVNEIMQNAVPLSNTSSRLKEFDQGEDTLIAVVDNKVVPDVHNLGGQIKNALETENSIGLVNFLKRVGAVAEYRRHSAEDLMNFIRRGDLPLTDSGDILVYKALNTMNWTGEYSAFTYADIHSGNVPQRVGSLVIMDESLVDPDRRNECSNGLHIARRQYLSTFKGSVCVVALIRPEDVIAVPERDADKMRVCAYRIIHELNNQQYQQLLQNKPILDDEDGQNIIAKLLAGKHIGITNAVRITGPEGGGIVITELEDAQEMAKEEPVTETRKVSPVVEYTGEKELGAPVVKPLDVVKQVKETKTRKQQIQDLYEQLGEGSASSNFHTAKQILDIKKKSKVSWERLGLDEEEAKNVLSWVEK